MPSVRAALETGKGVVTANKALLAKHGVELAQLAEERGAQLSFEAAVGGGIPIIKTLREALAGNRLTRVYGILNGTCNFILTKMEEGGTYADGAQGGAGARLCRSRSDASTWKGSTRRRSSRS